MRNIILSTTGFLLFILLFFGCTEDDTGMIPVADELLVVDGWIENGRYAKVFLTKTAPYFSSIDSSDLQNLTVTKAKVTVSDGESEEVLILRRNDSFFPPFFYEGNELIGEIGKTYSLRINYASKTFTSTTTIPVPVPLDSISFGLLPEDDSLGKIYLEFRDPPEMKNYYRILTKRKGKDSIYSSTMLMCIDDFNFNGKVFGFYISNGPETFLASYTNDYFSRGDTVSIKFCTIDSLHFRFWNSLQDETFNAVNPFATSLLEVESNIDGDALGIWGGYGASRYTFIIR